MKHLTPIFLFAFFTVSVLEAQKPSLSSNTDRSKDLKCVSLEKTKSGENLLVVNYPWQIHKKASIEVRLVTDEKSFNARVKPLRFSMIRFDDDTQRHIFGMHANALVRPSEWKARVEGLDWKIIGHANHRGRESLWFVNQSEEKELLLGTSVAFYPLDPWAINDKLLMLDLPRDSFDKPGKLYVWFLRGDRIIWQEEFMWPGKP